MPHTLPHAETDIAEAERLMLSERDSLRVLDLLENRPAAPDRLVRAAKPASLCGDGSTSVQNSLPDRLWQRDRAEEPLWVQTVIAGLVYYPKQAMPLSGWITKRNINLPTLKRCRMALAVDAHDQLF